MSNSFVVFQVIVRVLNLFVFFDQCVCYFALIKDIGTQALYYRIELDKFSLSRGLVGFNGGFQFAYDPNNFVEIGCSFCILAFSGLSCRDGGGGTWEN